MSVTDEGPETYAGLTCMVIVPSPTWPRSLRPQHHTLLAVNRMQVTSFPAVTARVPAKLLTTFTGVRRCMTVPSPDCPDAFAPQHETTLFVRTAHVCWLPAPTSSTSELSRSRP